ncbi:MAG: hypothetical protein LQ340_002796 [Diploschistes diacapsis]|nr:MAG: hypothetical protein LQ340_002796 [Diploschistes diacapsis]
MRVLLFALELAVAGISQVVHAAGGTSIPIALYTDIHCDTPSTLHPNASLSLGVCAVTPGLGSISLPAYPCTSGDVHVWAFADTSCGNQDDIFSLGNDCDGRANPGAYAAIMLNCDSNSPGTPTATTTIDVGPIATGGAAASLTPGAGGSSAIGGPAPSVTPGAGGSPASPSSFSSSSNISNGWYALSQAARIGIIVGSVVVFLALASFGGRKGYQQYYRAPVPREEAVTMVHERFYSKQVQVGHGGMVVL